MRIIRNRAQAVLYDFWRSVPARGKVLIPASTCEVVPVTYMKLGMDFELVDIECSTQSMDLELAEQMLQKDPSIQALHYVYNYGYEEKSIGQKLRYLREKYSIQVIEDKCLCLPCLHEPRHIFSDLILFSTGYGKYVDVGGGFGYLNEMWKAYFRWNPIPFSKQALREMKQSIDISREKARPYPMRSARLDWLENKCLEDEEAYMQTVLQAVEQMKVHKEKLNAIYSECIPKEVQLPYGFHAWRFQIRTDQSEQICAEIFREGLFASRHYQSLGNGLFSAKDFPRASEERNKIVNLFNDCHYTEEMATRTAKIIARVIDGGKI